MHIVYPVRFDDPVDFAGHSITQLQQGDLTTNGAFTEPGNQATRRNGYDSSSENSGRGLRVTNISGVLNGDLLKWCPRCENDKPQAQFDPLRTTNERRDQSNCVDCRSQY
jgi:hypothetical protein